MMSTSEKNLPIDLRQVFSPIMALIVLPTPPKYDTQTIENLGASLGHHFKHCIHTK